jgi:NAD(P)-dependent dehydrogenase (short-subunit alcohol dehydrogenase family)
MHIMSNWFITGISRGFGKALALEVLAQGHSVADTESPMPDLFDNYALSRDWLCYAAADNI